MSAEEKEVRAPHASRHRRDVDAPLGCLRGEITVLIFCPSTSCSTPMSTPR
jgi:hypothetical protein